MHYNQDRLRSEQVQYRCTKTHKEQLVKVQKLIQAERHYGIISIADVMERAITELHQSLNQPKAITKPTVKKKSIKKSKTVKS